MTRGSIIVAGSVTQRSRIDGPDWMFLQYLLGLKHLDWDVLFADHPEPAP
jgi:hypothetical protein